MQFIDKHGFPVETIKGRPITNIIRRLLHTRKMKFGVWHDCPECGKELKGEIDTFSHLANLCWDCLGKGAIGQLPSQLQQTHNDRGPRDFS